MRKKRPTDFFGGLFYDMNQFAIRIFLYGIGCGLLGAALVVLVWLL